jgi:hypothetical protein
VTTSAVKVGALVLCVRPSLLATAAFVYAHLPSIAPLALETVGNSLNAPGTDRRAVVVAKNVTLNAIKLSVATTVER